MNHKKLSILIIAEEVNYDRTSGGLVNAKLIYSLSRYHQCEVLTEGHVPADFSNFHQGKLHHFRFKKMNWLKWLGKVPVLRRTIAMVKGINHASFHKYLEWKREIGSILSREKYDAVLLLGTGMGYYAHQAWADLPETGIPTVMCIHDPYPMALLPPPYNAPWDRGERLLTKRFSKLIDRCRYCWSSSLRQLEWMYETYPALKAKGVAIPHLAMEPLFDEKLRPSEENELTTALAELHTAHQFLLVHMGSLLRGRDPQYLLTAFRKWLADHPAAAEHSMMVFVGRIHPSLLPAFDAVKQHPNFLCSTDVRISYQHALALQQSATANIILESLEKVSPQLFGKFADAVLSDRPIMSIGPVASEARRLLGAAYPYQATNGDSEGLYNVIDALYNAWQLKHDLRLERADLQYACHPDRVLDAMEKLNEK